MEFLQVLNQGWIGIIIGATGIIIAIFIYRASRVSPQLVHQDRALRLVGSREQALPKEAKILFKNRKVERLTKTLIILWNSGKAIVNGSDIVFNDPLRIKFSKGSEVLSAHITKETRKSNKFKTKINSASPNEAICSFDYLEPNDGVVIDILHTDKYRYPEVLGAIRGMPKGVIDLGIIPRARQARFPFKLPVSTRFVLISNLILALGMFAYGFIRLYILVPVVSEGYTPPPAGVFWAFVITGLMFTSAFSFLLWSLRRRSPRSLATEDYEESSQE